MDNLEQHPVEEAEITKKQYNAPSVLEFGDITNLVNANLGNGGDANPGGVSSLS